MSVNVGTAVGFLDLDTSGWTEGLNSARAGMSSFMDEEASFSNRMKGLGGTMKTVGKTMSLTMTTSLTAIAGVMTNKAKEMQAAVQIVSRAVGESVEEVEKYKDVIASIYASNLGDSFEDVASALALVKQQMRGINDDELEGVTAAAIQLRDVFDIDVNEGIRGANALMKQFGISAEEAYNYIAIGAQNGLNQNKDLADQISEYAVYYADLGMSVQDMFNAMYSGTENGVYQVDYLNDAYKEFGIRVKDTAKSTTEGFELLGLNADLMRSKFAAGGESARQAFDEVILALSEVDDQVIQNQAGVDLFGTKWEDIGQSTIMAITQMNNELDLSQDLLGSMRELTMDDFSRQIEVLAESFGRLLLPYLISGTDKLIEFIDWVNKLDPEFKSLIVQLGLFAAAAGPVTTLAGGLVSNGQALVTTFTKVSPIIATVAKTSMGLINPFTAAITVIGLLYAAYKNNIGGIKDITDKNIESLKNAWNDFIEFAPQIPDMFIAGLVGGLKSGAGAVVEAVKGLGDDMYKGLMKAIDAHSPSRKAMLIGKYWDMGLAQGIITNSDVTMDAMSYLSRLIQNSGESLRDTFVSVGEGMNSKLYSGIYNNSMRIISVYESERNKRVSLMTQGTQENLNQIQRELNATQQAYQIKMQLYQQEYNARVAMVDEAVSDEVAALQAQIDAIDEATERERRAEEETNYQERLAAKEEELKLAKNEQELAEIQAEMDELIYARQKQLLAQQRADEQKALREQIQEAYARANERKAALQEEFEAKQLQLQQQRDAEIEFMTQLQELLREDLELRKELAETQKEISTREEKLKTGNLKKEVETQTRNEIQELRRRESEIKLSMDRNKITFENFTPKLQKIGNDYGTVLKNGIMQYEGVISNFLSGLLRQANNVIDAMQEAASMAGAAETAVASYNSQAASTPAYSPGGNTYNFYSNEAMTPTEISRQFKKTETDLALGF